MVGTGEGSGTGIAGIEMTGKDVTISGASDVLAEVLGVGESEARIEIYGGDYYEALIAGYEESIFTGGTLDILGGSTVVASTRMGPADAYSCVELYSGELAIEGSTVRSQVLATEEQGLGDGHAEIDIVTPAGVMICNSNILAEVSGEGHVGVYIYNEQNDGYWPWIIEDLVGSFIDGDDGIGGPVYGAIDIIDGSSVEARANSSDGATTAIVAMATEDILTIENSTVSASENESVAGVLLFTEDSLRILGNSTVSATTNDCLAGVLGLSLGDIKVDAPATVSANGGAGFGLVALAAPGDIYAPGTLEAVGNMDVIPVVEELLAWFNLSIDIGAQYEYGGAVLLGSLEGDITLGDINTDLALVAALGGNIFDAGDVVAHYLAMLAYGYIGTSTDPDDILYLDPGELLHPGPINTNVDILTAYSWGRGDIFINEADAIELGLYLPIFEKVEPNGEPYEPMPLLEIGISVAANDGIISIVSQGDMLVNSVVSPRGGVFLQSTGGSIYAGHGWCPIVNQGEVNYLGEDLADIIDDFFGYSPDPGEMFYLIGQFLMGLEGTPWHDTGEIDYFSPIMIGLPMCEMPLPPGPNVIAGGYSYFSAPHGTIGVGTPDAKDPTMSGGIKGIVRPAVIADTGTFPAPDIDLFRYEPPGYVLYEDTDENCCPELFDIERDEIPYAGTQIWPPVVATDSVTDDPLAVCIQVPSYEPFYEGPMQVTVLNGNNEHNLYGALPDWFDWQTALENCELAGLTLEMGPPLPPPPPPVPVPTGDVAGQLANPLMKNFRAYYEILDHYRVVSVEPATPTTFYAYHPLTSTDSTAFDEIVLDIDAYEFIAGNIKLKKTLAPYFGEQE